MGGGRPQSEGVGSIIGRLRFVSSSSPAVYLNERLAEEMFLAQLGSIGSFTRAAGRNAEGQAGAAVVRVGASRETSEQVDYDLKDPLTRALLLHSALGGARALAADLASPPGTFLECVGPAHLPPVAQADPRPPAELVAVVEGECRRQTDVVRALGDDETVLLPLLITDQRGVVGAVVDRRWVRPGAAASYLPLPQVAFGIVENVVDGLPLVTVVYMRAYL